MLSQTFCSWDKQQSAVSNVTQFHLTLKCKKGQSSHFCDCFLVLKRLFQHHDRGLTKFHAGPEQLLVCVVIKTLVTRPSKTTDQLIVHLGNAECRLEGFKIVALLTESYLLYMSTKRT